MMQTSARGRKVLQREEGTPLRAYRDIVGRWTIFSGLTAASGVVKPHAGMEITWEEGERLQAAALAKNYEPAVAKAMGAGAPAQHEFDAGVLFHWNTGAIGRASWVRHWKARAWAAVEPAFKAWKKAGGKVVPGLVSRRQREYDILRHGRYPAYAGDIRPTAPPINDTARLAAPITAAEVPAIRAALSDLGYAVGLDADAIDAGAVRHFQRDHGLTADGIIGIATATTLQRVLDARAKAKPAAGAVAAGGTVTGVDAGTGAVDSVTGLPGLDWIILGAALAYALWLAWQYRDAIAGAAAPRFPRLAAFLRRF